MSGIRMMYVPDDIEDNVGEQQNLQDIVRKEIKRDRKKANKESSTAQFIELAADMQVLNAIGTAQQQLLTLLQNPPRDPLTGVPISVLSNPPNFGYAERAVLRWTANGILTIATSTYNAISGIRAEALLGFLVHGMDPRGKKSGLFGGGIGGLLLISALGGGGLGLFNIFGGSSAGASTLPNYGGIS